MKKILLPLLVLLFSLPIVAQSSSQKIKYSVERIWCNGSHCAFTSLIKFKGRYYCSFREGVTHIFDKEGKAEGKVRVLVSKNGKKWKSALLVGKEGIDLRDPKLSITPDGRLMIIAGGSIYRNRQLVGLQPQVIFSDDGENFTEPQPVKIAEDALSGRDWLWRVTWDGATGYVVNYASKGNEARLSLLKTSDGISYDLVTNLDVPDFPNETTLRLLDDKRMLMMVRRERGDCKGYWGVSYPPYTDWDFKPMEMRLGGQDFLPVDENNILMSSRSYYIRSYPKTAIYKGKVNGKFQELMTLPSGGDCSYPGMMIVDDELWVTYYSTHETPKASIYLAKIPLKYLGL